MQKWDAEKAVLFGLANPNQPVMQIVVRIYE
jgi:hypothetical protein